MAKKTKAIVPVDVDKIAVQVFKTSKFKAPPSEELIESTVQEIESTAVQLGKIAREAVIKVGHKIGEELRRIEKAHKVCITKIITRIGADNRLKERQWGQRNLYYALLCYDRHPDFESIYDTELGENITWSKWKKMVTTPKPKTIKTIQEMAYDLVDKLGVEAAEDLVEELKKEIDRRAAQRL